MTRLVTGFAAVLIGIAVGGSVTNAADEHATKEQAVAMVKKAVAFIKDNGGEKAYAEISKKGGPFTDRDLYITIYRLDGHVFAHGANDKLIGTDQSQAKDTDGKPFVAERLELAKKGQPFWQEYRYMNPVSHTVEPKEMYCEPLNDVVVCGGVYKF